MEIILGRVDPLRVGQVEIFWLYRLSLSFSIYCQTLLRVLSASVLCKLQVAGWKPSNTHINNITSTANKTLGFVKRNVVTKNKDIKTMAYNSLVRPQVEYASVVWSPYTKDNINKIEKVQRRAARWVTNDYSSYSCVTDMLSNLGWRSLENRRTDTRLAMFYKIVYGLVAIPLPSYFEHPEVYTRHMHSLSYTDSYISLLL